MFVAAARDYDAIAEGVRTILSDSAFNRKKPSPIPDAIRRWIRHLCRLDQSTSVVHLGASELMAEEARGLAILREQREKFKAEHLRCSECNSIYSAGSWCLRCGRPSGR